MLESRQTAAGRRALVTGCAGFVGSHLAESLLADHQEVVGVDCFNDNYGRAQKLDNLRHLTDWNAFEFVPIDLARGDLLDLVDECALIFHLAAEPQGGDVRDTAADTKLARETFGFSPRIGLTSGLSAEFDWIVDELARNRLEPLPS